MKYEQLDGRKLGSGRVWKWIGMGMCAVGVLVPGPLPAHGEADEEVVEHFDEHLGEFEKELWQLTAQVERLAGIEDDEDQVEKEFRNLVKLWESVAVHQVIEIRAMILYPPVWKEFHALRDAAADESSSPEAVFKAGERAKAALWQGLGGLKLLAAGIGDDAEKDPKEAGGDGD